MSIERHHFKCPFCRKDCVRLEDAASTPTIKILHEESASCKPYERMTIEDFLHTALQSEDKDTTPEEFKEAGQHDGD